MLTGYLEKSIRTAAIAVLLAMISIGAAAQADTGKTIQPNSHLTVEGIPPISEELAQRVAL